MALGCGDGKVHCLSTQRHTEDYVVDLMRDSTLKLPVTSVAFRPTIVGSTVRNVLAAGTAAGTVEHWHITSKKRLHSVDIGTEVYCLSYRPDAQQYACAGKDGAVHIGDASGKGISAKLFWAEATDDRDQPARAHSSRVQSVKWIPQNNSGIISGGWDESIQIWDTRVDHSVGSMYGAYICGDALCMSADGTYVYSASCRDTNQIQVRDIRQPEGTAEVLPLHPCKPATHFYSIALSEEGSIVAAGSTDLVVFQKAGPPVSLIWEDASPLFATTVSPTSALMAASGAGGEVMLYDRA